jgi:hypothetical protein
MVMLRYPTRFFVYPFVYLVSVVPVTVVTLVLTVFAEDTISSFLYGFEGDFTPYGYLAQTSSLLVIAIPVYGLMGLLLYRSEETSRPLLLDHLRHCVFLYGLFFVILFVTTLSYQREIAAGYTQPVGPGTNITLWVTGCAILMNLLALLWWRSRSDESGGEL